VGCSLMPGRARSYRNRSVPRNDWNTLGMRKPTLSTVYYLLSTVVAVQTFGFTGFTYVSSQFTISNSVCPMLSRARYPCASAGSWT